MRPSIQARDRPWAGTERARITSRRPRPVNVTVPGAPASSSTKRASTSASVAPARTMPASALPPSTSWRASTTSVLPAPVSPVSAVMPGPNVEREVLDHPEVADPQLAQHVVIAPSGAPDRPAGGSAEMPPNVCGSLRTTRTGLAATRQRDDRARLQAGPRPPRR